MSVETRNREPLAPSEQRPGPGPVAGELADAVLMVRPAAFAANPETAATNRFQQAGGSEPALGDAARREFDGLANALSAAGIDVIVLEDTPDPPKPDAVFPNNWLTTHADGTLVLYPMLAPSRRNERRSDLCEVLRHHRRTVTAVLDLSPWEWSGLALEGTGSLVLDRRRTVAYACRSERTAQEPLVQWSRFFGYSLHVFDAVDVAGVPIYHTNVMMALGRGFAIVGLDSLHDERARRRLRAGLEEAGNEVIGLSQQQVAGFGANVLHLEGSRGPVLAMSAAARESLGPAALACLERYGTVAAVPIPVIERYGGGSVRCMLAEIFLPKTTV